MTAASDNSNNGPIPPGKGMFGWLGRQVGYVRRAVNHQLADPAAGRVFRSERVEEQTLPHLPNVKLRRTTIDELVIDSHNMADSSNVTDKPPTAAD